MPGMTTKISVSLTDDDLEALDAHVRAAGLPGRSAGVAEAIRQLRAASLERAYETAFLEEVDDAWETTSADGIA